MQKHQPVLIDQAFPIPGTPDVQTAVSEQLYLPENAQSCPLIVRAADFDDLSGEIRALNDAGYAVYVCFAPQKELERDEDACNVWLEQLNKKLDALLQKHPQLDEARMGVDGWIAAYVIFHSGRFSAAVQRPALINPATAYGNCAAGYAERFGDSLQDMMCKLAQKSVLKDVDSCRTPCLVVWQAGEKRYSREQSEQFYAAMKDRNPEIPCRMTVFTEIQWQKHALNELTCWWRRFFAKEAQHE